MDAFSNLNFKHLRYFWSVAKTGSIARASEQLHKTPQSISGQLTELESVLGVALFTRVGRRLELTEMGKRILSYADEIFALGNELIDVVKHQTVLTATPFRIGISDSVPKSLAYRVVQPALQLDPRVRLVCREGRLPALLAELALHRLDLVVADQPMTQRINVRAYNHLIGRSDVTVLGAPSVIKSLHGKFPACLDNAPFLLPGEDGALRPGLMQWFSENDIRPQIIGEFDDGALLKYFGQAGAGLFVVPSATSADVCRRHSVKRLGAIDTVTDELYAITTERRLKHPGALAIVTATQKDVFAS
ncbi:MAG: transcriptional activator NhaR [Rhodocyclaceae bacterium]|nr:transcriptional activator NhaR [Rhodocyclaceae bacterium]